MPGPLTPTELVYLLGDRFAGPPSFTTGKYELLKGETVALNPLAESVLLAAFLGLERDGDVRLERAPKSTFFGLRKTHTVYAERIDGGAAPVGTVEAALLSALGPDRVEVDEAVYRWFGEDDAWPHVGVMNRVRDGLAARGLVDRTETQTKGLLRTKTEVAFALGDTVRDAVAGADPEPLRALLADAGGRPDLRETLLAEVREGIQRRVERDMGGDWPE